MSQSSPYVRLAERLNFPNSRYVPLVLRKIVNHTEAEMLVALPALPEELAKRFNMSVDAVKDKLDDFVRRGVAIPLVKEGTVKHFFARNIMPQLHDATIHASIRYNPPYAREIHDLWRQFRETEWLELLREIERAKVLHERYIPYPEAVKDSTELLPHEDLKAILKNAPGIAVVNCPCRYTARACDKPVEVCLSLGAGAVEYISQRGIGRKVDLDEAYEIVKKCQEAALVPSVPNGKSIHIICFCCSCCCMFQLPQVKYGYRLREPSRFQAVAASESCNGCEICVDVCPFGAIKMRTELGISEPRAYADAGKCVGCGNCVLKCPAEAISLRVVRPPEFIPETARREWIPAEEDKIPL